MDVELRMQQQLMMIEQRLAEAQQKIVSMMEEKSSSGGLEPSTSPNKPFKCTVCDKSFEHSGKLHRHLRIHTGERPHECNICGKSFIQSGQLVIHMRLHTGDRPYSCQHCDKAFTCSKQLKVHLRTHTKEKPYKCEICGKCFGYNHVLKLHQVAHFGEKIYKCTICDSTFNKKKHLEAHIRSHKEQAAMLPSIETLPPPPASPEPAVERRFLLPSIDSLPSTVYNREWRAEDFDQTAPQDLSHKPRSAKSRARGTAIRRNPLYPVTASLVKNLLAEDLAEFGPPSPLASPRLNPHIYGAVLPSVSRLGELMVSPLTPPPSVSPPLAPSPSLSAMSEHSLPPRKRRYAFSECSETDTDSRPSPSASPMSDRSSVICFGIRH